eukprot:CAMPEP_0174835694 /NCGR_PEP_ID=MMETSP1114-20130205/5535_1 /TAXON_ID=312471 /ORGANISM="Neobodo designis, Strain CCAP 1951/1" /LENGTH=563 /DNA_ID=CAMNT_0016069647 /DNA_START=188 /DNA_END=1879 /DNA_ORIENTATION=-
MDRARSNEYAPSDAIARRPKARSEVSYLTAESAITLYRETRSTVSSNPPSSLGGSGLGGSGTATAPRKAPPKSPPAKPQASLRVPSSPPPSSQYYQRSRDGDSPNTTSLGSGADVERHGADHVRVRAAALLRNAGMQHVMEENPQVDGKGFITIPEALLCKGAHGPNTTAVNCDLLHLEGRLTPALTVYVPLDRVLDSEDFKWGAYHDHVNYGKVWPICTARHAHRRERDECTDGLHVGPPTGVVTAGGSGQAAKRVAILIPTHLLQNNQGLQNLSANPTHFANMCNAAPCRFGDNCTWTHLKPDAEHPTTLPKGPPGGAVAGGPPPLPFGCNTQRSLARLSGALKRTAKPAPAVVPVPDADSVWAAAERDIRGFFEGLAKAKATAPAIVSHEQNEASAAVGAPRSMLLAWDCYHPLPAADDGWTEVDDDAPVCTASADSTPMHVQADVQLRAPALFSSTAASGGSADGGPPSVSEPAQLHLCAPSAEQQNALGKAIQEAFPVPNAKCARLQVVATPPRGADDEPPGPYGDFATIRAQLELPNADDKNMPWQCTVVLRLEPLP